MIEPRLRDYRIQKGFSLGHVTQRHAHRRKREQRGWLTRGQFKQASQTLFGVGKSVEMHPGLRNMPETCGV